MDNNEMIEKLKEKAGLSYEDAYNVLESVNWNFLDAVAALEKEGIIKEKSDVIYSTRREERIDDQKNDDNYDISLFEKICKFFVSILEKSVKNNLHLKKNNTEIVNIPVIIPVVFLCFTPLLVIALLICAFFCGCSFYFSGDDLGKEKYNSVLEKIRLSSNDEKDD